jgi:EAL domain-containing protein (putative c-di-GMP-specific phosphodiesterase class I)
LDLSVDLRAALNEDLLELHYQPIIELSSGRLLALEALARWNHPQRGPVSPEEFVSIAEQSGFVQHLDRWVLSTATADLADLRAKSHVGADVYVSVNVSALHLTQGDLEGAVADALARSGLPHRCLGLEVTETAVMMDHEAASSLLSRIVDLGVSIALDDFGTGYSSLAYLKRLPVARLKIDRTFVENLPNSPDDLAIVASVLHLSKAVGVQVIAEGVETAEQLDLLARLDCHSAQGYYWSRPVSKARLISLLEDEAQFDVRALDHEDVPMRPPSAVLATHEHGLNRLLFLHQTGASLRTVAAALNSEGYRTPLGTRWHPTSVAAVVADYAYPSLWTRG